MSEVPLPSLPAISSKKVYRHKSLAITFKNPPGSITNGSEAPMDNEKLSFYGNSVFAVRAAASEDASRDVN